MKPTCTARGASASIETTGPRAVQALLKSGRSSADSAESAHVYCVEERRDRRAWGSTQATIMAFRAVLLSLTEKGAGRRSRHGRSSPLNGTTAETLTSLTSDNNDLLHQFVLKNVNANNAVEIRFHGTGGLAYQIAGRLLRAVDGQNREPAALDQRALRSDQAGARTISRRRRRCSRTT